jgi:hypothetical protein
MSFNDSGCPGALPKSNIAAVLPNGWNKVKTEANLKNCSSYPLVAHNVCSSAVNGNLNSVHERWNKGENL